MRSEILHQLRKRDRTLASPTASSRAKSEAHLHMRLAITYQIRCETWLRPKFGATRTRSFGTSGRRMSEACGLLSRHVDRSGSSDRALG